MKNRNRLSRRGITIAGVILASAVLPSCKLPPRDVLTQIQRDTLVGFLAEHHERSGALDPSSSNYPSVFLAPETSATERGFETAPMDASMVMTGATFGHIAESVPGKPGYVFTPHTAQKLMVDVRIFDAGDRVLCPYTRKPFTVPAPVYTTPVQMSDPAAAVVRSTPSSTSEPMTLSMRPKTKPEMPRTMVPSTIASGPSTKPLTPLKKDIDPSKPVAKKDNPPEKIASTKPETEPSGRSKTAAAPKTTPKKKEPAAPEPEARPVPATDETLPVGTRIPGKPNFVYSPFASKNQVVNVAGFAPGTKVRCPYSGKLFRVPADAENPAAGKKSAPKEKSSLP